MCVCHAYQCRPVISLTGNSKVAIQVILHGTMLGWLCTFALPLGWERCRTLPLSLKLGDSIQIPVSNKPMIIDSYLWFGWGVPFLHFFFMHSWKIPWSCHVKFKHCVWKHRYNNLFFWEHCFHVVSGNRHAAKLLKLLAIVMDFGFSGYFSSSDNSPKQVVEVVGASSSDLQQSPM